MGLLKNWLNKKKKEQLEKTSVKTKPSAVKEKKTEIAAGRETAAEKPGAEVRHEPEKSRKSALPMESRAHAVLLKPLVTEKSAIAESVNKYSFIVARRANKNQVKQAVMDVYKIKPVKVNIINADGRQVRFGRTMGRRSDYKKAIVTLPPGKTIDIHTGV